MSGTGVQSAMRRRTRPPDDHRRQSASSNNQPPPVQRQNANQGQGQGQGQGQSQGQGQGQGKERMLNPGQILYMHQAKIRAIEKTLENLGVDPINASSSQDNDVKFASLKTDIEATLDKRLSVISNNLNFVLNGLNEERLKTKRLEATLDNLSAKFATIETIIEERIESRIDRLELRSQEEVTEEPITKEESTEESTTEEIIEEPTEEPNIELEVTDTNIEDESIKIDAETLKQLTSLDLGDINNK